MFVVQVHNQSSSAAISGSASVHREGCDLVYTLSLQVDPGAPERREVLKTLMDLMQMPLPKLDVRVSHIDSIMDLVVAFAMPQDSRPIVVCGACKDTDADTGGIADSANLPVDVWHFMKLIACLYANAELPQSAHPSMPLQDAENVLSAACGMFSVAHSMGFHAPSLSRVIVATLQHLHSAPEQFQLMAVKVCTFAL